MLNYSLPILPTQSGEQGDGDFVKFLDTDLFIAPSVPSKLNVITNSLRNTFLDCGMKYYWEYIRRLSPNVTQSYFVWGSFLHYAMEMAATATPMPMSEIQDNLRDMVEKQAAATHLTAHVLNEYEGYILLIPHVLEAYLLHHKAEYEKYEVIMSEHQFVMGLGNGDVGDQEGKGWTFEGKIDKIVRDTKSGVCYVWDIKTPAATGPAFFSRLPLDSQMKGYVLACQKSTGINLNNALYDVIQKPSIQQKLPCHDPASWAGVVGTQYLVQHEKLFKRHIVEYKQWQIDHYFTELCQLAKVIDFHQREGIWLQHHPGNRIGYCPFFDLCVDGEYPVHLQKFRVRNLVNFNNELPSE